MPRRGSTCTLVVRQQLLPDALLACPKDVSACALSVRCHSLLMCVRSHATLLNAEPHRVMLDGVLTAGQQAGDGAIVAGFAVRVHERDGLPVLVRRALGRERCVHCCGPGLCAGLIGGSSCDQRAEPEQV